MTPFDFPKQVEDGTVRRKAVKLLSEKGVVLPSFEQLADPSKHPAGIVERQGGIPPDAPNPGNLFRVNWFNDERRTGRRDVPVHLILPSELTGVGAKIAVALGAFFPMIAAHKVLAAYACLVPRLVSGRFDPLKQLAVWPSTGNYCRGGVAISRILGCRGVAVLPEGMSRERFDWLSEWVSDPADIVRTPGTESNVKEIYDACDELARDPAHEIVNQFSEFGNYLGHYACTGPALEAVFKSMAGDGTEPLRPFAFVAASGSSGTLGAGDYLKDRLGAKIAVVEPVECPTLLYNGYGEHNIQGIGDKHVPLIHNVMNSDFVIAVSDRATDALNAVFNTPEGRAYLSRERKLADNAIESLHFTGFSGIANILASIKLAKYYDLGEEDVILTVATDGAGLYESERRAYLARHFPGGMTQMQAASLAARHLDAIGTDHMLELREQDRHRIFNLGYYTWVEQRGIALADFEKRRSQSFWRGLRDLIPVWDEMIDSVNRDAGVLAA
ncbi:MAG: pyridoxal-phosphate dependent enzyme [Rhodomicrobium sp.]|nr:pyridoxal-phosphate dependent enzyme [Rhodomicrobium sp.]